MTPGGLYTGSMPFISKKELNQVEERLETLERMLTGFEGTIATQASALRNLETEWLNTHEKFKAIMGRLQKRDAKDAERPPEPPDGNEHDKTPGPYDHLDPISKGIHERRAAGKMK